MSPEYQEYVMRMTKEGILPFAVTNPSIHQMIATYLEEHGFNGLTDGYECGCEAKDLCPCDEPNVHECKAGYKVACTPECDEDHEYIEGGWHIQLVKPQ